MKSKTQKKKLNWANKGGSSTCKIYKRVWSNEKCRFIVEVIGEYDIAQKIQAANNVSDLALFYKQLEAGVIQPDIKSGEDIIAGSDELLPKNIHEFKDRVNRAYASFAGLPEELRKAFNNDESIYLSSLADGSYTLKIASYIKTISTTPILKEGDDE